jgi:hypothetical protein
MFDGIEMAELVCLAGQHIQLRARKRPGDAIDLDDEIHRTLPDQKIREVFNVHAAYKCTRHARGFCWRFLKFSIARSQIPHALRRKASQKTRPAPEPDLFPDPSSLLPLP